jgi:hypothetical protein
MKTSSHNLSEMQDLVIPNFNSKFRKCDKDFQYRISGMQDLVIPNFKEPAEIGESPLLGFPAGPRETLLFFRGDFRDDGMVQRFLNSKYSGYVRQKLHYISRLHRWDKRYNILIGSRKEVPGDYAQHLISSRFCLVLPGMPF